MRMGMIGSVGLAVVLLLLARWSPAAFAEKTMTFIVPFAAGGSTGVVSRIPADHMSRTLGQPIVIETVVGAGGRKAGISARWIDLNIARCASARSCGSRCS
jgi:tripartite-type tricarboxylate transporter receptor subunit TctC